MKWYDEREAIVTISLNELKELKRLAEIGKAVEWEKRKEIMDMVRRYKKEVE